MSRLSFKKEVRKKYAAHKLDENSSLAGNIKKRNQFKFDEFNSPSLMKINLANHISTHTRSHALSSKICAHAKSLQNSMMLVITRLVLSNCETFWNLIWHVYACQRLKLIPIQIIQQSKQSSHLTFPWRMIFYVSGVCLHSYQIVASAHKIRQHFWQVREKVDNQLTRHGSEGNSLYRACGHWTVSADDSFNIDKFSCKYSKAMAPWNLWKCVTQSVLGTKGAVPKIAFDTNINGSAE